VPVHVRIYVKQQGVLGKAMSSGVGTGGRLYGIPLKRGIVRMKRFFLGQVFRQVFRNYEASSIIRGPQSVFLRITFN